jgi:hypothetical protein
VISFVFSSCGFFRSDKTWAQNGRKTPAFWAQIKGWLVSKGSRINVNFADFWSGRWESNPRPKLVKLTTKL